MYVNKMIDKLGFRLEDTAAKKFPTDMRLDILNDSQLLAVNLLHNDLLTELQVLETALSTSDGTTVEDDYYPLTSLANSVARNGIVQARIAASGKYFNIIPFMDVKQTENAYIAGSDTYPVGYVFKNRFYVKTTTNTPTIDIWYIKQPSSLKYVYTSGTVTGGAESGTGYIISIPNTSLTSTTADFYNGSVVYNKTKDFYAIVYDYTVSPNTIKVLYDTAETEWATGDEFYFVNGVGTQEKLGDFESELNDSLHELIIDLSESTLWKMVGDIGRSDKALAKATEQINALNERAKAEAAAGIGTKAQGS